MYESGHSEGTFLDLNDNAREGSIPSCPFSGSRRLTAPVHVGFCGLPRTSSRGSAHSRGTLHLGHDVGARRSSWHTDGRLPSSCCSWVSTLCVWSATQRHKRTIAGLPNMENLSKGFWCEGGLCYTTSCRICHIFTFIGLLCCCWGTLSMAVLAACLITMKLWLITCINLY
jgi:hypothetical protein